MGAGEIHDRKSVRLVQAVDRLCPGREFADATLFLAMASMISALDIAKAQDAEGKDITPAVSFASSSIVRLVQTRRALCLDSSQLRILHSYPNEFPCRIQPRSEATAAMVMDTLAGLSL